MVIVCAKTYKLEKYKTQKLDGYVIHYNKSKINKNDGVVMYIKEGIEKTMQVIDIGRLKIINTIITTEKNQNIEISALYRSHDLPKTEFIMNLNIFLSKNKNNNNHLVIGDDNIHLLELNCLSQELLNNFLEKGYVPCFQSVTRPPDNPAEGKGSCIDNVLIKTNTLNYKSYTITNKFTDHYPLFISIDKIDIK